MTHFRDSNRKRMQNPALICKIRSNGREITKNSVCEKLRFKFDYKNTVHSRNMNKSKENSYRLIDSAIVTQTKNSVNLRHFCEFCDVIMKTWFRVPLKPGAVLNRR